MWRIIKTDFTLTTSLHIFSLFPSFTFFSRKFQKIFSVPGFCFALIKHSLNNFPSSYLFKEICNGKNPKNIYLASSCYLFKRQRRSEKLFTLNFSFILWPTSFSLSIYTGFYNCIFTLSLKPFLTLSPHYVFCKCILSVEKWKEMFKKLRVNFDNFSILPGIFHWLISFLKIPVKVDFFPSDWLSKIFSSKFTAQNKHRRMLSANRSLFPCQFISL